MREISLYEIGEKLQKRQQFDFSNGITKHTRLHNYFVFEHPIISKLIPTSRNFVLIYKFKIKKFTFRFSEWKDNFKPLFLFLDLVPDEKIKLKFSKNDFNILNNWLKSN